MSARLESTVITDDVTVVVIVCMSLTTLYRVTIYIEITISHNVCFHFVYPDLC